MSNKGKGRAPSAELQTTGATQTPIFSFLLPVDSIHAMNYMLVGKVPGAAEGVVFQFQDSWIRNASAAPARVEGTSPTESQGLRTPGMPVTVGYDVVVSSNDVVTRVTGKAGTIINWSLWLFDGEVHD